MRIRHAVIIFMIMLIMVIPISILADNSYVITIKTDKAIYGRGETVGISGNLTSNGNPIPNTMVGVQVNDPEGNFKMFKNTTTGMDGFYSTEYIVEPDAKYGNYTIYVAKGYARSNTTFEVSESPPPDTTPLEIMNIHATTTATTATITWRTDEPATSQVEYGLTAEYGYTISKENLEIEHSMYLSNLKPSTTYHYRIKSSDTSENQAISADRTFKTSKEGGEDTIPPSKVAGLVVIDAHDGKLNLSWSPATDNVAVDHYKIYRDDSFLINESATSYQDTGLTNDQSYTYQISAVDTSGNEGTKSDPVSGTPTETPPAQLNITDLKIKPLEVKTGEIVTITVNVTNMGKNNISHDVKLQINGIIEKSETISLKPEESLIVEFTISKDKPGTYEVTINGLTSSFTVKSKPTSMGLIIGIIAAVAIVVTILAIFMVLIRKSKR